MTQMVILARPEMAEGFQLSGVDVRPVENNQVAADIINTLLANEEPIILAIDDGIFRQLDSSLTKQVHKSEKTLLVTIPEGPMRIGELKRMDRVYEMIRHATGARIRFKSEVLGNQNE